MKRRKHYDHIVVPEQIWLYFLSFSRKRFSSLTVCCVICIRSWRIPEIVGVLVKLKPGTVAFLNRMIAKRRVGSGVIDGRSVEMAKVPSGRGVDLD